MAYAPERPGPQNPGKYPQVGPSYRYWGEQPGYIYNPWTDRYVPDPKAVDKYETEQGLKEPPPKQPGLGGQIGTGAAILGGAAVATEFGKDIAHGIRDKASGLYDKATGYFKDTPKVTPTVENPTVTNPTAPTTPTNQPTPGLTPVTETNIPIDSNTGATPGVGATPQPVGGLIGPRQLDPNGPSQVPGPRPIGPSPDGGTIMDDGSVVNADQTVTLKTGETVNPATGEVSGGSGSLTAGQAITYGALVLSAVNTYQTLRDPNASTLDKGMAVAGTAGAAGQASLATTGATTIAGSTTAASAVPFVNLATGLYTGYKTAEYQADAPASSRRNNTSALSGAAAGASIGAGIGTLVPIPVVGTAGGAAIGALVGAAAGFFGSKFGSSKGEEQMIRDKAREYMIEKKLISEDYKGTLADGSSFDFGKDGKGLKDLDYKDPATGQAIALGDLIAAGEGYQGKAREAMARLYTAAAMSNANGNIEQIKNNFYHFASQRGFSAQAVQAELDRQLKEKQISEAQHAAFSNTLNSNFGRPPVQTSTTPPAPTPPATPGGMMGPNKGVPAPIPAGQTPGSVAASGNGMMGPPPAAAPAPAAPVPIAAPYVPPPRSRTVSPGISKSGQRIQY